MTVEELLVKVGPGKHVLIVNPKPPASTPSASRNMAGLQQPTLASSARLIAVLNEDGSVTVIKDNYGVFS